jgi:TolB-like protein
MRMARSFPLVPLAFALVALTAADAGAQRGRDPIARLEAARAANPSSIAALRALGVAYYKARRYTDARSVLDHARRLEPRDGVSALYAGLSAEALGDLTSARAAYDGYLAVGKTRRVKDQVRARLVALQAAEVEAAAKAAVANEAQLSQAAGPLTTVAVPPLLCSCSAELQPLSRGLAELIITDLSRSSRLTVVERDRMQAIADEIRLSESDRVDQATAVRAGRLIQAGRLVSGSLIQSGNALVMNSRVVLVQDGTIGEPAQVENDLGQLFAMQKALVLRVFDQLGITLTPAERQLVDRRPTTNLNAFLAYSRGLQASDDGRFQDAARFFESARSLDPAFSAAAARAQSAQAAAAGAQVSAASIEANLGSSVEGEQVSAAAAGDVSTGTGGLENTLRTATIDVNPSTISPVANDTRVGRVSPPAAPRNDQQAESTGSTSVTSPRGVVVIIITRP